MTKVIKLLTLMLVLAAPAALAQEGENPIPPSGGALRFAEPEAESEYPNALDAGWEGEKTCALLFENAAMRAARCTFPPGVGHERHWHPAHWAYVIAGGTFRITDENGTTEREYETGYSWWSDGVEWHEGLNTGDTTAVYILIEFKAAGEE